MATWRFWTNERLMSRYGRPALLAYMAGMALLLLAPTVPDVPGGQDGVGHLVLFMGLAVGLYLALLRWSHWRRVAATAAACAIWAILSELLQIPIPNRTFDLADIIADLVGTAIALGFISAYRRIVSRPIQDEPDPPSDSV